MDARNQINRLGNGLQSKLSFYLSLEESFKIYDDLDIRNLFVQ
jgi:hypothetical protein